MITEGLRLILSVLIALAGDELTSSINVMVELDCHGVDGFDGPPSVGREAPETASSVVACVDSVVGGETLNTVAPFRSPCLRLRRPARQIFDAIATHSMPARMQSVHGFCTSH